MAKKILTDINMNKLEAQNVTVQNLASDPNNPVKGQVYFNTTTNRFRCYNGTSWDEMGTGGGTVSSVAVANDTNGGLSVSGSPITSSGTIKVGHSNVLSNAQTTSGVYPIKIDKNGHISEYGTAVDFSTYAPLASPALTGTPTAPTASSGTNTTQIATTAFVTSAISGVSGAMVFKGTVGTGGTESTLPTTGVKVGDTYKVCTAGTYASQSAKVGDLFIATATTPTWAYVPSGDDTGVTSVTAGAGLNTTSDDTSTDGGSITSTGTLYLTKSGVTAGTYNSVTVDKYGRVTSGSSVTHLSKYSGTITGNASTTAFDITHNLGTRDVIVQVYDSSTYEEVIVDVSRATTNKVTITFATAPSSSEGYKVVVIGQVSNMKILSSITNNKDITNKEYVDNKIISINDIYPVGSIYMSVNSTSPATLFGGTWQQIKDTFLLACGDTYSNGATGGEATHLLTADESGVGNHYHTPSDTTRSFVAMLSTGSAISRHNVASGSNLSGMLRSVDSALSRVNTSSVSKDASTAHNNMPPYLAVYMWQRTA